MGHSVSRNVDKTFSKSAHFEAHLFGDFSNGRYNVRVSSINNNTGILSLTYDASDGSLNNIIYFEKPEIGLYFSFDTFRGLEGDVFDEIFEIETLIENLKLK